MYVYSTYIYIYIYVYTSGWLRIEVGIDLYKLVTLVALLLTQRPDVLVFMTGDHQICDVVYHLDRLDPFGFG